MALIHDFFNYNDPVKSNKDESNAENSFFFVQMKLYADQFKKLEPRQAEYM